MRTIRQIMRVAVLYISSTVLIAGVPMATFADQSDICAGAGHWSDHWEVDPTTQQCIRVYDGQGNWIGPDYMKPLPQPPAPDPSPSPSPSIAPTTPTTQTPVADPSATTVTDTGNNNATGVNTTNNGTANTTSNNTPTVNNTIGANSTSGTGTVQGNESNGGAATGNASTQATLINTINSSTGDNNSGVAQFTYDINGNVVGDITINGNNGPIDVNHTNNLTTNTTVNNNPTINNAVNLNSTSGDATVQGNESNGSATSGSANTVANIVNLINTVIAANQSFVGTINIYGNLNGDILLSPEFIPQLLASNGGSVTNTSTNNLALSTNINDNNNIVNNVQLNAASGGAKVQGNESQGSATTGQAQTNLTILNLTGHTVTAANSLLVFVNVLGTWVGMIVDAPGATAAAIGNDVTLNNTNNITANANLNNNAAITNNVNLASQSGNALVNGNESSGNATSGKATASANIANVSTSTFDLSGWFGVLFINVFGKWVGSFGVDTSAGTLVPLTGQAVPQAPSGVIASPAMHFGFIPGGVQSQGGSSVSLGTGSGGDLNSGIAAAKAALAHQSSQLSPLPQPREDPFSAILMIAGFSVAGISGSWMLIRRRMEMRAISL